MTCKKCRTEYEGNFCPNCGAKTTKHNKLLGFRSNKTWKKSLSIIYMFIVGLFIVGAISSIEYIGDVIETIIFSLLLIAPYIFLSDFKLRNKLPLFNKHKIGMSILGMLCVYFAILLLYGIIRSTVLCNHEWVVSERVEATCTEDGYVKSYCELCNSNNIEYIDKTDHAFELVEDNEEKIVKKCSICGEEATEDKKSDESNSTPSDEKQETTTEEQEHQHKWTEATCEQPSMCNDCGVTKDVASGHTTDCGVCSRCNKEFRKQSPITIIDWTYSIDSVGGVEWNFNIKNNTDKQIKYVTLKWDCYNAVGDLIYDEISFQSYVELRFTGPLDAYASSERLRNTTKFYNYNLRSYVLTSTVVEYMDGTIEEVTQYHDGIIQ